MHNKEYKLKLEDKIIVYFKELNYIIEIKNEARMYLWYKEKLDKNINQYKNSENAIDHWIVTFHSIGITKENDYY